VHRISTSGRYQSPPWEIRARWTWRDALEAHAVIDAFEDAER
jgi:hypothetical protein